MSQLNELKKLTIVVADSGDIDSIRIYSPQDATTNPSLILKAAPLPQYKHLTEDAIRYANEQGGEKSTRVLNACDALAVNIGAEILKYVPGRISTEVDARLSFDRGLCVAKARKLIQMYAEKGIDKSRVLIKLASTWEGIRAAEELERENINCNLTLLFSFAQARACADAGVYLISPFVGRIYDWYQKNTPAAEYVPEQDPGVVSVRNIYEFYKKFGYETVVMGASFRRKEQIIALAGCDRLTIAPQFLDELEKTQGALVRQLSPSVEKEYRLLPLTEAEFRWLHNEDPMATEKLAEGIRLFARDQEKLETMIADLL
ncbi:transaldolase [Citrobacter freundii]|uniref:transaldolase n=2 Tax=Citrobacter freundii TaxID=546 RepID=UPI0008FD63F6|nr:transaldolase [Citrobacter freundii]EKV4073081.1 transaldolase [Citrobacter freundii]EKV5130087.1 transaldolase [Citrobacter freundii]EKW1510764.1 transaldolase [Citrobacter freundii]ELZ9359731.1 transaldolase [Citrobacter freundii]MBD5703324.1 transaldolase [Citrobacter freundii]